MLENKKYEEEVVVEAEDCEEVAEEEMTKWEKAKAGIKKFGKPIALAAAGITIGIISYGLGSMKSGKAEAIDYDPCEPIDTSFEEVDINNTEK